MAYRRRITVTRSGGRRTVSRGRSRSLKANHRHAWLPRQFTLSYWFGGRRNRKYSSGKWLL